MKTLPAVALILCATLVCAADVPGVVRIAGADIPFSAYASDVARDKFVALLKNPPSAPAGMSFEDQRKFYAVFNRNAAETMRKHYAVVVKPELIGGVQTDIVTPTEGIDRRNQHRVLINLHGGAFMWGARDGGLIESIPIASIGKIKVITVDYREAPENRFPAASEDVAKVYAALLKDYAPHNIGIYGCSAGGLLTAESVAWISSHALPMPGAVGTFCASVLDLKGDSSFLAQPLTGQPFTDHPLSAKDLPYFAGASLDDPMVVPGVSKPTLAKFPPTLLITGSRDFAMSSVIASHALLIDAGVDAELHVFDGMWHGFFGDPDLPESKSTYGVITRFFDRHLGT